MLGGISRTILFRLEDCRLKILLYHLYNGYFSPAFGIGGTGNVCMEAAVM